MIGRRDVYLTISQCIVWTVKYEVKENVQEKWIDLLAVRIYFVFYVKNMSLDYSQQKTFTFISKNKHRFLK